MRVLVAGIGNVFLGDDGFGVEVVHRLAPAALPENVDVVDVGIRGVHLAYELLDERYDTLILVDVVALDAEPGALAVMDATAQPRPSRDDPAASPVDAHSMSPDVLLRTLHSLGGHIDRVLVVGCRPAELEERMGLSAPVQAAVGDAVRLVTELAFREATSPTAKVPTTAGRPPT